MQLGVVGLSTMGGNLARNAARNGASVAIFNRTQERTDDFVKAHKSEGVFIPCKEYSYLVAALKPPRPILLMVKAGEAVDAVLGDLTPLLSKGDILIDGGNSHFRDTERRMKELAKKGIRFVGMGVSGGEEGALYGPSMMPGGDREGFDALALLLSKMAADDGGGGKCVTYVGPGGSGHFVKMVHNGIEYGIMQLIAESYDLLTRIARLDHEAIAELFEQWMQEDEALRGFLMEITPVALRAQDPETRGSLLNVILDAAEQKGTGKWTVDVALEYGVSVPTITAAVDARIVSSAREFRVRESERMPLAVERSSLPSDFADHVRSALSLSIINAYAQGFQLLSVVGDAHKWDLPLSEIARIWRGGCIIRSALLERYQQMFSGNQRAAEMVRDRFSPEGQHAWRHVASQAALRGIPVPAISASLSYFDAYRTARLPQNLIQAQRDLFGAHGYRRTDREGTFHHQWQAGK